MKVKLLKKLRKKAKRIYFLESDYPYYYVCEKTSTRIYYKATGLLLDNAKNELNRCRRSFILREVRKIRDEKINKEIRKL